MLEPCERILTEGSDMVDNGDMDLEDGEELGPRFPHQEK